MDRIVISEDLRNALKALSFVRDAHPDQRERLLDTAQCTSDMFRVKKDSLFTDAGDLTVTLEPTERFFELVAAVGALER